ncbi:MAG: LytTR family DNA-binding domain-containing protein [Paludibacteraceae bacterium]|nr:response regulator transcription factor [Paludibacteraceae bacterium]MCR5569741.1 LytTR family DNA-binding domain-containing protein [Paludibacteraceae bacterium]
MGNTQKIKVMVIDDEFPARKLLSDYISKVPNLELCKQCSDALEASAYLQSNPIDLLFTDIQMPELSGLDFVKSMVNKPMVVFTTAYSEYALESYDLEAVYYLLKPISFASFMKAVNKATELFNLKHTSENTAKTSQPESKDFLMVKADYKLYKINFDDLIYIEGQSEYVTFHMVDKKVTAYYSLKKLEEELPSNRFLRIHKSYIVAQKRIEAIEGNMVVIGKEKLSIGKNYKDMLMQALCKNEDETQQ